MKYSVYDYFSKITEKRKEIAEIEKYIKSKREEVDLIIKSSQETIDENISNIQQIRAMEIYANIGDIATNLARHWNVPEEDIEIFSWSNMDYISDSPNSSILNTLNSASETYGRIYTLFSTNNSCNSNHRSASITSPIRKDALQADGKPLIDHLVITSAQVPYNTAYYEHSLKYDDPKTIIAPFAFNDLMENYSPSTGEVFDPLSKAILDAADMLIQSESEMSK